MYTEVDKQIVIKLCKKLPDEIKKFYTNVICVECADFLECTPIYEYVYEIIQENFFKTMDLASFRNNLTRNINKVKKRAVQEILGTEDVLNITGMDKQMTQEFLQNWEKNPDNLMYTFPYLEGKAAKKKLAYFKNDVTLLLARIITTDYDSNIAWVAPTLTNELSATPIFGVTETMIDLILDEEYKREQIIVDEYYTPEDYYLRTLVKYEDSQVISNIATLDQVDQQIISLIYSMIRPGFYLNRSIDVNVVAIANQIYTNVNQARVLEIENRIKKIGKYQCEVIPKATEGKRRREYIMINFFERVYIDQNLMTGKVTAQLTMGETLYKSFLKRATKETLIYSSNELSNRLAKLIMPSLQADRLKLVVNEASEYAISLDYFKSRIRFRYKRDDTVLTQVKVALEHLQQKGIVVQDSEYDKKMKVFKITFLPLTEDEKYVFRFSQQPNITGTKNRLTDTKYTIV